MASHQVFSVHDSAGASHYNYSNWSASKLSDSLGANSSRDSQGACRTSHVNKLARTFLPAGEVRDQVEQSSIDVDKHVKELASLLVDAIQATGKMFKEEHLRMINMVTAINPGGSGGKGGNGFTKRGIVEHKVITNLRCVNGDRSLVRQWH